VNVSQVRSGQRDFGSEVVSVLAALVRDEVLLVGKAAVAIADVAHVHRLV